VDGAPAGARSAGARLRAHRPGAARPGDDRSGGDRAGAESRRTTSAAPSNPQAGARRPERCHRRAIGRAIQRAADYLYTPLLPPEHPERYLASSGDHSLDAGVECLAVYALLQAGLSIHDNRLDVRHDQAKWMIDAMKRCDVHGSSKPTPAGSGPPRWPFATARKTAKRSKPTPIG